MIKQDDLFLYQKIFIYFKCKPRFLDLDSFLQSCDQSQAFFYKVLLLIILISIPQLTPNDSFFYNDPPLKYSLINVTVQCLKDVCSGHLPKVTQTCRGHVRTKNNNSWLTSYLKILIWSLECPKIWQKWLLASHAKIPYFPHAAIFSTNFWPSFLKFSFKLHGGGHGHSVTRMTV